MPTPMKFRAITANCGNDVIGTKASNRIVTLLKKDALDFVVVNCQEVDFAKAKKQLENAVGPDSGYTVTLLGKMSTHTKLLQQLHRNTGLASYVIHKNDLSLQVIERTKARRDVSRFSGAGFNKGALVIDFIATSVDKSSIRMQTVSGHFDSKNTSKRTLDWGNTHNAVGKQGVNDWEALVRAVPNIRISGYDANTRNQYVDPHNEPIKIWESETVPQELKAFQQAPLGGRHYSVTSTYKTSIPNINTDHDPKRPGYVRGGMLDFVDIAADVESSSSSAIITKKVVIIPSESDTKRDHDVIISPMQTYDQNKLPNEFSRVKNQLMTQLRTSAPDIVKSMEKYTGTEADKKKLVKIYQDYLGKCGLINKQIVLHADLLNNINKIKKINGVVGDKVATLLLTETAWFSASSNSMKTKQAFQEVVSEALAACKTQSDLDVVHNALHVPNQNPALLKATVRDIIDRRDTTILADVHTRSMKRVDELMNKMNSTHFDEAHPEKKAAVITQAALEFTGELHKELKLLQKINSPGKDGAQRVLQEMGRLVKVLVINLANLFGKENTPAERSDRSKKIDNLVRHVTLNLPYFLDKLRLNLKSTMVSGFSKLKTKSKALQSGENNEEKSSLLNRR